eukprot:320387-Rhodomonas_salina.1
MRLPSQSHLIATRSHRVSATSKLHSKRSSTQRIPPSDGGRDNVLGPGVGEVPSATRTTTIGIREWNSRTSWPRSLFEFETERVLGIPGYRVHVCTRVGIPSVYWPTSELATRVGGKTTSKRARGHGPFPSCNSNTNTNK